jgi:hypothetical protein
MAWDQDPCPPVYRTNVPSGVTLTVMPFSLRSSMEVPIHVVVRWNLKFKKMRPHSPDETLTTRYHNQRKHRDCRIMVH